MKLALRTIVLPCILTLISCSGGQFLYKGNTLKIETDPPGATLYILGKPIGKTPITITDTQLYPPAFDRKFKHLYGFVEIRMEKCETTTYRVEPRDFSKGLFLKLKCEHVIALNR